VIQTVISELYLYFQNTVFIVSINKLHLWPLYKYFDIYLKTATENGDVTPRSREAVIMGRRGGEQEGLVAPSSSPTQSNMQEQLKLNQEEARRR